MVILRELQTAVGYSDKLYPSTRTKITISYSVELRLVCKNYVRVVHTVSAAWKRKSSNNCTLFHESNAVTAINANGWSL